MYFNVFEGFEMAETFLTQIISLGRVTVPEAVREILNLKDGDRVRVTIEKATST